MADALQAPALLDVPVARAEHCLPVTTPNCV